MTHQQTTPTEEALGMSLPADLRDLSVEEVQAQQSIPSEFRTFSGGGGGGTISPVIAPVSQEPITVKTTLTTVEKKQGLTLNEKVALIRREQIRRQARERGRGFTRLTVERKLGGGLGIRALRSARRKGFRVPRLKIKKISPKKLKPKKGKIIIPKTFGLLEPIPIPISRLERELKKARDEKRIIITQILRAKNEAEKAKLQRSLKNLKISSKLFALETAKSLKDIPSTLKKIIKDPKQLKKVPGNIKKGISGIGETIRLDPTSLLVKIAGEILVLKGIGKLFKVVGSLRREARAKITNTLKGVKTTKTRIFIPRTPTGKPLRIEIVKGTKQVTEPLARQIRRAGKRATVISSQADRIVSIIKKRKIIRKPIPGEAGLKTKTKALLKKFDKGKISKNELIILDARIKRETGGAGSLLERSFFADPGRRIRTRRLAVRQREASLLDILEGDFTFRTQKPQILVFQDIKIEKLPKALADIKRKLKQGKTLTPSEANRLLKFQLKGTGKFKPVGFLSKEAEVTLAPSEIVKKGKTIAFVKIDGVSVPIVTAKVIKAKPITKSLLKKARSGKITSKELRKLKSNLKKETGFKTSVTRRITRRRPRARAPKIILRRPRRRRPSRRRPTRGRITRRRPSRRRPTRGRITRRRGVTTRRPIRRRIIRRRRIPGRGVRRRIRRPISRVGVPAVFRIRKRRRVKRRKAKKRERGAFDVFARPTKKRKGAKRSKLIKINKVPLTRKKARDLGSFIVDKSLSRTFKIRKVNKKPLRPKLKVPSGHFRLTRRKFRTFKIVKGRRVKLKRRFIEKKRNLLDTPSEKKGITLRKAIKQLIKPRIKIKKRKIVGKQRVMMLKNLAKARRVKASKKIK